MTKVAYKTNVTNPNLPNGFITDHFDTENDAEEGYTVTDIETFSKLLANNVTLMRMHEANYNQTEGVNPIVGAHPYQPPHPKRPNSEAEPAATASAFMQLGQRTSEQDLADAKLFREFLAWKRSQGTGDGSGS